MLGAGMGSKSTPSLGLGGGVEEGNRESGAGLG